ncbi:MAG TPA: alpha/beta fold hydrolase [Solirubrobacteraceae bacterium]|nr:alpha/beta fold hydrolase [Solirubrobacteraceae bacterium]
MRAARPAPVAAALAAALLLLVAAAAQAAPRLRPCPKQTDFGCGVLTVPLDRSGHVPGTIALHYAARSRYPKGAGVLVALSGGPGQQGVAYADSFAESLHPALARYRLVVVDQRGTGLSGALSCPNLQPLGSLDPIEPQAVAACAARLGPRRAFYTTTDTVQDLEALRIALGVPKLALMGISYGTHVALQYARQYPTHVDRLILDSIVGPAGPDGFLRDTYSNLPRILREQCSHGQCDGITKDPVGDVAAVARQIERKPISGKAYGPDGRARRVGYGSPEELSFLVTSGDLNPFLQAALPGAIAAARAGDPAELLRLHRAGEGPATATKDLSFGLNVTTGCEDADLPYSITTPLDQRPAMVAQATAALDPALLNPFDAQTIERSSYVDDCLDWPTDATARPSTAPLPDVPALLLSGRLDTRTPLENGAATHAQLPHSSFVTVPGTGHDELDSDYTGCANRALERFIRGVAVGDPCAGKSNQVAVLPLPPRSLGDFRSAPAVGGDRGRALFAVLDTVLDARVAALQALFAGFKQVRGGGLYGGTVSAPASFDGRLTLSRYSYLRGLRVSGRLTTFGDGRVGGTVRVQGRTRATSGRLRLTLGGGAIGTLGGRHVRYVPGRSGSGRAASVAARSLRVRGRSMPRVRTTGMRLPAR